MLVLSRVKTLITFQFTHPGKGATPRYAEYKTACDVSIHAPWEGCDVLAVPVSGSVVLFQFTHPGKGATHERRGREAARPSFNSRTLGRVRLSALCALVKMRYSFNSRTLGRVRLAIPESIQSLSLSFNSRTLGRVRHISESCFTFADRFQFTHPGKGATTHGCGATPAFRVSIHAPWEGCDHAHASSRLPLRSFNSRTLGRVRRDSYAQGKRASRFNSRTLGRVRQSIMISIVARIMFQFTHPGKGATWYGAQACGAPQVSIHAPWEGCDTFVAWNYSLTT